MTGTFYAHSANTEGQKHLLATHLTNVAKAARNFAGDAPWTDEAVIGGQFHDLGKYADLFQARLRENRMHGLMRERIGEATMVRLFRLRQTKEAAKDKPA